MPVRKNTSKKEDAQNFKDEIIHEFHVISEGIISQVKQVAEGVVNVDQKLDRTRLELKAEIEEKTKPIAQAVVSLDGKVNILDDKVNTIDGKVNILNNKANLLEGKLDRINQELRSEIQETRKEVLAAVKFSYAELDKRLTTLEKEFLELKIRVEKIENRPLS
jgi:chromosome segregation ATPase